MWIVGFEGCFREVVSEDRDGSLLGMEISCDELHQRCLPSSACPDESGLFSLLDRDGEAIEYFGFVIAVGDIVYGDGFILNSKSISRFIALDRSERFESRPKDGNTGKLPENIS